MGADFGAFLALIFVTWAPKNMIGASLGASIRVALRERDPVTGAEARVKPTTTRTGIVSALAPGFAHGSDTKIF